MERTGSHTQFLYCPASVSHSGLYLRGLQSKSWPRYWLSWQGYFFSITQSLLTCKKAVTAFVFNLSDLLVTYPTI